MSAQVHPTACIDPHVEIEKGVSIGPYCRITGDVKIGQNTVISSHVSIQGPVTIGEGNIISSFVVIGFHAQHLKDFHIEEPLVIGNGNILSSHVTINQGIVGHPNTSIGDHNFFGDFVHIAHNCIIGNFIEILYGSVLAGHVELMDRVHLGAMCAASQFARVGRGCFFESMSCWDRDIPPYTYVSGRGGPLLGISESHLKQKTDITNEALMELKELYSIFLNSGVTVHETSDNINQNKIFKSQEIYYFLNFIKTSKKGIPQFSRVS